nr:histidine decarboxylase [Ischnura senegalensis]
MSKSSGNATMDFDEYRKRGKEMVDWIADYLENIRDRRVFPDVKPGYLRRLVPDSAPFEPEPWEDIFADVERVVMPGVTTWQSPHMHAYFPALNSFPSLLGDMLADAINCLGFTWASSPACTELETVVMDWLGKMIGLPDDFLHSASGSQGGGVIQTTASEATFVALLAGRTEAIRRYQKLCPDLEDAEVNSRLVAYCSDQAHSSVEKAGLIGLVKMRYIETDENLSLRGDKLRQAIAKDRDNGLVPFYLCATLGTTGACSFDNLKELGPICKEERLWLHVDAAYAGTAFICPEFRGWLVGIEYVDSIAFNPSKWMMVHFDCTAMWVRNSGALHRTFNVDPLYLQHENSGLAIDYMHWQIPLSKRFRALKLWFVIRNFGIKGLQKHIREGVRLAKEFEHMVRSDKRFVIAAPRHLGLVVFRLAGSLDGGNGDGDAATETLLKRLNASGKMHAVPASLRGRYVIRFTVTSQRTTIEDIREDWELIRRTATAVLRDREEAEREAEESAAVRPGDDDAEIERKVDKLAGRRAKVPLGETRERNENFGSSLLLANSPMSPKVVNGSFAAVFDQGDVMQEFARKCSGFRLDVKDSPAMRRRIRGILVSGRQQFSLDSRIDMAAVVGDGEDDCYGPKGRPLSVGPAGSPNLPLMREEDSEDWGLDASLRPGKQDENGVAGRRTRSVGEETVSEQISEELEDDTPGEEENEIGKLCHKCGHVLRVRQ